MHRRCGRHGGGLVAVAQSKDPFVGTWVLNVGKSKYSPGPLPKSATTVIETAGSGYRFSVKQMPAIGAALEWSFTTALDGKPAKITGNNPNADMVTYERIDATTLASVNQERQSNHAAARRRLGGRQDAHGDHHRSGLNRPEAQ